MTHVSLADKTPITAKPIDPSPLARDTGAAHTVRDLEATARGYGATMPDGGPARNIFDKDGIEGLRRAAAAAGNLSAALRAIGPGALMPGQATARGLPWRRAKKIRYLARLSQRASDCHDLHSASAVEGCFLLI